MYFGLSEEQELLQETVRGFADTECPADKMRQHFDDARGFDAALWRGLAEIGIAGLAVDEAYGGAGGTLRLAWAFTSASARRSRASKRRPH